MRRRRYAAQAGPKASSSRTTVAKVNGRRPGQRLFQCGQADPGFIGKPLPRQPAARQFLAHAQRDRLTTFNFDVDMHGLESRPQRFRPYPHISAHFVNNPRC